MALRDVTRSPRRTAATALGTVLALVLVLASLGLMTSMTSALQTQYDEVERQDATVTTAPDAGAGIERTLRDLPGVSEVEVSRVGAVTVSSGEDTYATALRGFVPGTTMHGFPTADGMLTSPPDSGAFAGSALAERLGVDAGDTVTVIAATGGSTRLRIAGFVDDPMGTNLYATNDVVASALAPAGTTYLLRYDAGTDGEDMRAAVSTLPGVVAYSDTDALVNSLDQFLGLFWAFVAVMVLLGAVLALAIIYVTMAVSVVERTNELATLRAAGVRLRRVGGTLATENLAATLLGLPFGLALGVLAADQFLGLFSSDLFQLPLVMPWWLLLVAAAGVLLAAGLSQWPAVRAVRRLDVARVVRERAG